MALNDSKIRAAKPLDKSWKFTDSHYLTISSSGAKLIKTSFIPAHHNCTRGSLLSPLAFSNQALFPL